MNEVTLAQRAHLSSIAALGGLAASAVTDTVARAQKGQAGFRARFAYGHECAICPPVAIPSELPVAERERRADAIFRLHFARLARRRA